MDLRILDAAARDIEQLDKGVAKRIVKRVRWLAGNIDAIQLEALTGALSGLYKLRVGDFRVIYEILHSEETIVIHAVGHPRRYLRPMSGAEGLRNMEGGASQRRASQART